MRTLSLDQALEARRTAYHPGPPERAIQFLDDDTLLITTGAITLMLAEPPAGLPDEGWHHEPRCDCWLCEGESD